MEVFKVGRNEMVSPLYPTTTHVGRLLISFFFINLLVLNILSYVVNIKRFFFREFHGKKKELNLWEAVKVGSNEKLPMLVDFV